MRLIYEARERLIAGHVLGDTYEIAGGHESGTFPTINTSRNDSTNMEGGVEFDNEYMRDEFTVSTDLIDRDDLPIWYEFLASVAEGYTFTIDTLSDQLGVAVDPRLVYMVSKKHTPRPAGTRHYRFRFTVAELP